MGHTKDTDQAQSKAFRIPTVEPGVVGGGGAGHSLLPTLTDTLVPSHTIHSFNKLTHSSRNTFLALFS